MSGGSFGPPAEVGEDREAVVALHPEAQRAAQTAREDVEALLREPDLAGEAREPAEEAERRVAGVADQALEVAPLLDQRHRHGVRRRVRRA